MMPCTYSTTDQPKTAKLYEYRYRLITVELTAAVCPILRGCVLACVWERSQRQAGFFSLGLQNPHGNTIRLLERTLYVGIYGQGANFDQPDESKGIGMGTFVRVRVPTVAAWCVVHPIKAQ